MNLFDKVVDLENLYLAYRRARRGKRLRHEVMPFTANLEGNLLALRRELVDGSYRPGTYRAFRIRDPKPRLIHAAPFRDRVVHHALVAVIEPLFNERMIHDSYACRKGKGTHRALDRLDQFWRQAEAAGRPVYTLRMDVSKYFFSIDHDRLVAIIARRIRDEQVLWLVELIIRSLSTGIREGAGIPIGNLTSQLFANIYLDQVDHFVKEELRIKWYLRYMDDWAVFGHNKEQLIEVRDTIAEFLGQHLGLTLNPKRTRIFQADTGVDWLGWLVYPGGYRRLRQSSVRRARHRLRYLVKAYAAGEVSLDYVKDSIRAWLAHAAYGQTRRLRARLLWRAVF